MKNKKRKLKPMTKKQYKAIYKMFKTWTFITDISKPMKILY